MGTTGKSLISLGHVTRKAIPGIFQVCMPQPIQTEWKFKKIARLQTAEISLPCFNMKSYLWSKITSGKVEPSF